MKNIIRFMLISVFTVNFGAILPVTPEPTINNDKEALEYCKTHKTTYVVIVWPRGFEDLAYIIAQLNEYASVKYTKTMILNKKKMFSLYRALHKKMSYKSAKKYFKPYFENKRGKLQPIAALVFDTHVPLETILVWKKEIRIYIGESYYSIHINDHYEPETVEAAQAVFDNFC